MADYITALEAAERFAVSAKTIRRWCREGKFPGAVRLGRDWRIPKTAIENPAEEKSIEVE